MQHFARIDENNMVVQVIVSNQADITAGAWGDPAKWKYIPKFRERGAYANPGEFADIGYEYLPEYNKFRSPKPDPLWEWDVDTFSWQPDAMWRFLNNK
jgi:hypothetical protein